jgi:hypothetical protein
MQSTLTPQDTDPHDAFVIEPDVVLAARQASPDPVQELLSHLAHKAAQASPEVSVVPQVSVPEVSAVAPPPVVDTTFRAATIDAIDTKDRPMLPNDRHGFGWWLKRASVAFMFALCSAFAAAAWTHHGAAAKQMISGWLPPFVLAASPLAEKPLADKPAEQPDPAPVQAAADPAPAQPAAPTQAATPTPAQSSDTAAATATAAPVQPAPSTPSPSTPPPPTARDLAAMGQQIEQLKASLEQLKASQAQMAREIAKNSEPSPRPRASALPPRPVAAIPPRPIPAPRKPPRQAYLPPPPVITSAQPSYAMPPPPPPLPQPVMSQPIASQQVPLPEATVPSDDGPVIRPPMPLR